MAQSPSFAFPSLPFWGRRRASKHKDYVHVEQTDLLDTDPESFDDHNHQLEPEGADLEKARSSGSVAEAYHTVSRHRRHSRSRHGSWSSLSSCGSLLAWRPRSPNHSSVAGLSVVRVRGRWTRLGVRFLKLCFAFTLVYIILMPIVAPSYLRRPAHYSGTNPRGEKVFIAANIVDADLIRGAWGDRMVELIRLLGEENVFLSIYENDSGEATRSALRDLETRVRCAKSIISGHIDLDTFPSIQILPDERRIKRIAYLADVRNKAIEPLTKGSTGMHFDKLLFVNDVIFSPADAADLLFATNIGEDGRTRYHAACAMDFINPFKFYDTFASRDAEGYGVGVPVYPFFTSAGKKVSRRDVLAGKDAVRVKSCWGGMAAFEAKWFQPSPINPEFTNDSHDSHDSHDINDNNDNDITLSPDISDVMSSLITEQKRVRFRSIPDLMLDASECCLINADIATLAATQPNPEPWESSSHEDLEDFEYETSFNHGIYMNPFIRVAYDAQTHSWLEVSRRFEKLIAPVQFWINWLVAQPPPQARRMAEVGAQYVHKNWVFDGPVLLSNATARVVDSSNATPEMQKYGHWEYVRKAAEPGGFCAGRQLLTLKPLPWIRGQKIWERIGPPPGYEGVG